MLPFSSDLRTRTVLACIVATLAIGLGAWARSNPQSPAPATPQNDTEDVGTQEEKPNEPSITPTGPSTSRLGRKQRQALLKSEFEKLKRDADELADLAKSLQDEVDKSTENVFSLTVIEKADRIEKLARRIKGDAKVR